MKRPWQLPIVIVIVCTATMAETDINTVVHMVEARYAVRHHGIPLLGLAKPFFIGSGVSGLKIADFRNFYPPGPDVFRLREDVEQALGAEWCKFVETANRTGEWSVIYVRPSTGHVKMLIVTSEPADGLTVMQIKLNPNALNDWFDQPVETAKHRSARR